MNKHANDRACGGQSRWATVRTPILTRHARLRVCRRTPCPVVAGSGERWGRGRTRLTAMTMPAVSLSNRPRVRAVGAAKVAGG